MASPSVEEVRVGVPQALMRREMRMTKGGRRCSCLEVWMVYSTTWVLLVWWVVIWWSMPWMEGTAARRGMRSPSNSARPSVLTEKDMEMERCSVRLITRVKATPRTYGWERVRAGT